MPGVVHFWGPYPYRSPFHATTDERGVRARPAAPARHDHGRGPGDDRGDHARDRRRHQRHPRAAGRLPRRRARDLRRARHRVDRRRGDGRLRPLRRVVRRRPLGRRPRPHLLRQGRQLRLRPARRRGHLRAPSPRPSPSGPSPAASPTRAIRSRAPRPSRRSGSSRTRASSSTPARLGDDVIAPRLAEIAEKHPSVGEVRGLGFFWALELVRDRATREPLVPYNASGRRRRPDERVRGRLQGRRACGRSSTSTGPTSCRRARRRPRRWPRAWTCSTAPSTPPTATCSDGSGRRRPQGPRHRRPWVPRGPGPACGAGRARRAPADPRRHRRGRRVLHRRDREPLPARPVVRAAAPAPRAPPRHRPVRASAETTRALLADCPVPVHHASDIDRVEEFLHRQPDAGWCSTSTRTR